MRRALSIFLVIAFSALCGAEKSDKDRSFSLDSYMNPGDPIEGVAIPYYDDQNNLAAELFGDAVVLRKDGVTDVIGLRIVVYEEGQVALTLFAPRCFWKAEAGKNRFGKVYSEGDVLIETEVATICGRGFEFVAEEQKLTIHHDSKVLIKEAGLDLTEVGL